MKKGTNSKKTNKVWYYSFLLIGLCVFKFQTGIAGSVPELAKKYSIKLDVIPLYAVVFDVRKQLRLGLEVEKRMAKGVSFAGHLDFGLYDDYSYFKYFDFFNQNTGIQYNKQHVKTYGFHLLMSLNYSLRKNKEKKMQYFSGITTDVNIFQKKIKSFNSRTLENSENTFQQGRMGLGVHLGASYRFSPSFHLEAKGVFIARVLMVQSDADMKTIKPFKAVWFDSNQRFWFIPQFNICYDF